MDIEKDWAQIKALFKASFKSSLHCAIATVNEKNQPRVTPIGSIILGQPRRGIYFEEFTHQMPQNFSVSKEICVLAVNSSRWFWIKSLIGGEFAKLPAVRLYGTAGIVRDATDQEIELWQKRVRSMRFSKGHAVLWRDMRRVRELEFSRVEPINLGAMTPQVLSLSSAA